MKKTFIALMTFATALSCSKAGVVDEDTDRVAIRFDHIRTRVIVENASDITEFGVYAQMNLGDEDTQENGYDQYIDLLENEKVKREDTGWNYDNTRYWIYDRNFQFFSIWPYVGPDELGAVTDLKSKVIEGEITSAYELTFTVPETTDQDLLTAFNLVSTKTGYDFPESVAVEFKHELANINVKVWRDGVNNQNDEMKIKSVTLSNIVKAGTLTTSRVSGSSWSLKTEKMNLSKTYDPTEEISAAVVNNGSLSYTENHPAMPFGETGMLLIPQSPSSIGLKIEYELRLQNATDWQEKEIETVLTGSWTAGNRITYNVLLSEVNDITFYYINTTVDPWGQPQVGGTVIIK